MRISGKTQRVGKWLEGCPYLAPYLSLNAIPLKNGSTGYTPVYNDYAITEFIDGTKVRKYTFAISLVQPWSGGLDKLNDTAEELAAEVIDWINSAFEKGDIPDFGPECTITEIRSVQNLPETSTIYEDKSLIVYQFQSYINYREKTFTKQEVK